MADVRPHALDAPTAVAVAPRRTFKLVLAYDGTDFHGWQIQPDAPTIQGAVLQAARRFLGPDVHVIGASRTDAGVHALGQVASLVLPESDLDAPAVHGALNAALPASIRVLRVQEAPHGFDARRGATGKRYAYVIDNGAVAAPLWRRLAWHVATPLDVRAMRAAAVALRGTHDFSAFCAAPGRDAPPVCRLRAVHVVRRGPRVVVVLSADRFLHHMVRNIVGSLVEIGRGAQPPGWLADVLRSRDRTRAGPTAPPQGLLLVRVGYPG